MIAWIAARAGVSSLTIKVIASLAAALLIVLAVIWYGAEREREGAAKANARWADANARMQAATTRAMIAADAIAQQREADQRAQIKELEHEAAKGDDSRVGPGVSAVLDGLRRQQGTR